MASSKQWFLAGTFEQAKQFSRIEQLRKHEWDYIDDISDLRGMRPGSTVWLVGTYYERRDYDELAELCAARDIGLVRV